MPASAQPCERAFEGQDLGPGRRGGEWDLDGHLVAVDLHFAEDRVVFRHAVGQYDVAEFHIGRVAEETEFALVEVVAVGDIPVEADAFPVTGLRRDHKRLIWQQEFIGSPGCGQGNQESQRPGNQFLVHSSIHARYSVRPSVMGTAITSGSS